MKRLIANILLAVFLSFFQVAADATGQRVFNAPRRPSRLLATQFASNANVFTLVDPSPDGTPLTLTSATGISQIDGSVTVALCSGFTAPVSLTCYYWQQDY